MDGIFVDINLTNVIITLFKLYEVISLVIFTFYSFIIYYYFIGKQDFLLMVQAKPWCLAHNLSVTTSNKECHRLMFSYGLPGLSPGMKEWFTQTFTNSVHLVITSCVHRVSGRLCPIFLTICRKQLLHSANNWRTFKCRGEQLEEKFRSDRPCIQRYRLHTLK